MKKPTISIVIATFNSAKLLPRVFASIRRQSFPQDEIEVLILDGGSTDNTVSLAKKYECRVIPNPRTEPVYAKFLGYKHARGKYIVYLDHDEVMESNDSLRKKYAVFQQNKNVHAVIGSGYKNPKGYAFINNYINEFGDPFSFFIYRLSKDHRFFFSQMKGRYYQIFENKDAAIFDLSEVKQLPIIELCAVGSMTDVDFMKKHFPQTEQKPELIPHFFYLLHTDSPLLGMTKNDSLLHYSSDTVKKYLNKIRWRVKNNIYHKKDMGESGFTGREKYQPAYIRLRKYFFIPYAFTLVFVVWDAFMLSLSRRNWRYLIHIPLVLFTAWLILYHTMMKSLGKHPALRSYDETRVIRARKK